MPANPSQCKWPNKDGLRIGHLNICSAINKTNEIASTLNNYGTPFHVFGFSEARITDKITDSEISIPGYTVERRHPSHIKETGLIVYISDSITFKRLGHLEQYSVESIWLEISIKKSAPIIVGFIYRNPDVRVSWADNFSSMIDAVVLESKEYILLGDFNIDLLKPNKAWIDRTQLNNLEQLINTPTRVRANSKTLIDHIYVTNRKHIIEVCVPVYGCSDHYPVCLTWCKKGTKIPKPGHKTISYRSFAKFNETDFLSDLLNSSLSNVYNYSDPEEAMSFWYETFIKLYDKHAPIHTKRVKHYRKPEWLDKELQREIILRDELKKRGTEQEFKDQRNAVTALKRRKMKEFFSSLLSDKNNAKQVWTAINQLTNKTKTSSTIKDISPDMLNTHFITTADRVITNDRLSENSLLELTIFCESKHINTNLAIPPLTTAEVYNALKCLKQTNARGLDGLDGKILKLAAPVITETLTYVYNLCIDKSCFPTLLKQSKITPLYKSGDTTDPSNYRPISILSVLSKPLEKHINKHILAHLNRYDLLHASQSGFRAHHSCHTALTTMVEQWLNNINENKFCGALFVDFAKAFDVISHDLLLRKLALYGISLQAIQLLGSFLGERQQRVCINEEQSSPQTVKFGVPQGSVLGPLLFSIYINDLPLHITNPCELFADDTTIHSCDKNIEPLAPSLQKSADQLKNWSEINHMALNPHKTKSMLITTRQKRQNLNSEFPKLHVCNQTIDEVQDHKVLGITIDNNLSWSQHILAVSKNIAKKTYQLCRIKHFLNSHARKLFYTAHIQSSIDYSSTLWDSASGNAMKPLISIQKRAIKATLLKSKISHVDYKQLGVLPLAERLKFNKGVFIHKIMTANVPKPLVDLFSRNNARCTSKLNIPLPRIDLYKTSLRYSGSILWNTLPCDIRQRHANTDVFKEHLKKYLQS